MGGAQEIFAQRPPLDLERWCRDRAADDVIVGSDVIDDDRSARHPGENRLERLALGVVGNQQPVVSAMPLAELAYGLDIGDDPVRRVRDRRFRQALETFEVIPFGVDEAKLFGVLATLVRAAGRNPRPRPASWPGRRATASRSSRTTRVREAPSPRRALHVPTRSPRRR